MADATRWRTWTICATTGQRHGKHARGLCEVSSLNEVHVVGF